MMVHSPTIRKWQYSNRKHVTVNGEHMWVISDGEFTPEEIEELREYDSMSRICNRLPLIANFLPDDVRPEGVKKL